MEHIVITDNVFLIISDCGKLIAKGTPRNRYICHVDENDKKRYITYSSKGKVESTFKNSGFYLSDYVKDYIRKEYPEIADNKEWLFWDDIKHLFKTKSFTVEYKSVSQKNIE